MPASARAKMKSCGIAVVRRDDVMEWLTVERKFIMSITVASALVLSCQFSKPRTFFNLRSKHLQSRRLDAVITDYGECSADAAQQL